MAVSGMQTTGHGATIAFADSGFNCQMTSIGGNEVSRESLETTHLSSTDLAKTFVPGDLVDNGERELEFYYQRNKRPPITGDPELITITYGLNHSVLPNGSKITASTKASEVFLGFVTSFSQPAMVTDEIAKGTATIKISGDVAFTDET